METIIDLLRSIDFFNNNSSLTYGEMRDLAQSFTYETVESDAEIFQFGQPIDSQDKFYVILSGQVSVIIQNALIEKWDWAMSVYELLKNWKEKEFDVRVQKAMKISFEKYKKEQLKKIE